jgi:hypothetical protein
MSVMDDVAALQELAADIPVASLRQVQQTLLEMNAKLTGILGPEFGSHTALLAQSIKTGLRVESAVTACQQFEDSINVVAAVLQQAGS